MDKWDLEAVEKRHGAKLPHWRLDGECYFVTFRLCDSLPAPVITAYRAELAHAVNAKRRAVGRPLTVKEATAIKRSVLRSVEDILDNGAGSCILSIPDHADLVQKALKHFDGERYDLFAWCVMPNHVHAVLRPEPTIDLSDILHSWKSFTGHRLPPVRENTVWESESFDHIVRSEDHLQKFVRYTVENPVKAGLRNWEWVGQKAPA